MMREEEVQMTIEEMTLFDAPKRIREALKRERTHALEQREQLKPLSALGGSAGRPYSSLPLM
jgi:hypothetical protein